MTDAVAHAKRRGSALKTARLAASRRTFPSVRSASNPYSPRPNPRSGSIVSIEESEADSGNLVRPVRLHKSDQTRIRRDLERSLGEIAASSEGRSGIETERQSDVLEEAELMMSIELTASRLNMAWRTLKAIEAALEKLGKGEYGTCESCGEPIRVKRLEAIPWAALCTTCQSRQEADEPRDGADS